MGEKIGMACGNYMHGESSMCASHTDTHTHTHTHTQHASQWHGGGAGMGVCGGPTSGR